MRYLLLFISVILPCLGTSLFQQLSAPVDDGDMGFLRALNNYFGCKTWENGECVECSDHYVFNDARICSEVTPQCQKFNRAAGICEECYLGYEIFDGQCILRQLAQSIDRGCKTFQNKKCVECSARWYFDQQGICQPIHQQCRTWQPNGTCTSCYPAYHLQADTCHHILYDVATIDAFCSEWKGMLCEKCALRAYFGPDGFCLPVNDFCRTWDSLDGYCLTCYKGYDLVGGRCEESATNTQPPSDLGCKHWDWEQQVCLQCSSRWVFSLEGVCVPVSDQCKHHDHFGNCIDCYKGYELQDGQCVFGAIEGPSDLGCKIWDWEAQICLQCSQRWAFDEKGQYCVPVSDQCKEYNKKGKCTACYKGFNLHEGLCQLQDPSAYEIEDIGCKIWDWEQKVCLQCSYRWFQAQAGLCEKVSDQCKDYNHSSGECTSCYPGYEVVNGTCAVMQEDYCEIRVDGVCSQCYLGYRISDGKCLPANPLCKTSSPTGQCLSCFPTYALYKNICVPLVRLVNLAARYAKCCPEKLAQLKREGRIV